MGGNGIEGEVLGVALARPPVKWDDREGKGEVECQRDRGRDENSLCQSSCQCEWNGGHNWALP
jgi:hypothetical protein